MNSLREPINALTHLCAAAAAIPAMAYLLCCANWPRATLACGVFGASMIALYVASGLYHGLRVSPKAERTLRKLDHSMIAVLIAGSYTPFCLIPLWNSCGPALLAAVWILAAASVTLSVAWIAAPRWLSTGIYLLMGWLCVVALYPMALTTSTVTMTWLVAGGVFYTIGAIIYGIKKAPVQLAEWGFHEVFHLFIIAGTVCHYASVLTLL